MEGKDFDCHSTPFLQGRQDRRSHGLCFVSIVSLLLCVAACGLLLCRMGNFKIYKKVGDIDLRSNLDSRKDKDSQLRGSLLRLRKHNWKCG
jgi:hypothetical protein